MNLNLSWSERSSSDKMFEGKREEYLEEIE